MSFKKFALGVSMAVCGSFWVAAGCGNGDNGASGDDSGSDVTSDHHVDAKKDTSSSSSSSSSGGSDSGDDSSSGCNAMVSPFMPHAWAPPTPWFNGACSAMDISNLDTQCFMSSNCNMWLMSTNPTCLACLIPDILADGGTPTAEGALEIANNFGDMMNHLIGNFGGCMAHFDGDSSATGCGAKFTAYNNCVVAECSSCSDFSMPTANGPFHQCLVQAAADPMQCKPVYPAMACFNELAMGGIAAVCNNLISALNAGWCTAGEGGAPDGGGDATNDGDDGASDAPTDVASDAGGG
jgi:hypothetical protein